MIKRNRNRFKHGVVHSFTGTWEEAEQLLAMGLYLGVNGWYPCLKKKCFVLVLVFVFESTLVARSKRPKTLRSWPRFRWTG